MTALTAGLAAGAAAFLLLGWAHRSRWSGPPATWSPVVVGAVAVAGVAGSVVLLEGKHVVLALIALAVATAVSRDLGRRRRVAAAERRSDLVLAMCEGLASDLRAGQPPVTALEAAADDWAELAPVAAAAQLGADVPAALRALAVRPGAAQARVIAAAWQVAHRSGAGLAGALAMAADHLRDERATARVVTTEMAAAQATARLLAGLPIGVLLLGSGLGGDPAGFLLDTTPGLVCLCAGLALEYAGLIWLARIADQVTGRRR
jgi:tight adherence protein B